MVGLKEKLSKNNMKIKLNKLICQVCNKQIKISSFYDRLSKGYECNTCYISNKSKIK